MVRKGLEHDKNKEKNMEGVKRPVNNRTSTKCDNFHTVRMQKNPVDMVQSLVPHLPGLDRDTVYVISGPFPNYDTTKGHSQVLQATPVSPGSTVVAVPSSPPHCTSLPPAPTQMPVYPCHNTRKDLNPKQPISSPHMLHWDTRHPLGQTVPLRQPNPPVYYNVPSNTSSGLQSPASETNSMSETGSMSETNSMSETSSMSEDQENGCQAYNSNPPHMMGHQGYPGYYQAYPGYPGYQMQIHPHHPHLHQHVPVYGQQVYIS